jgi:putative FmdB family regulatory protein
MSQYIFCCRECKKEFTRNLHMSDMDRAKVKCPHCGSKRVEQLVTAFSTVTAKKS